MTKVFLLTFHGAVNYGAVLQAYALNKTLLSLGCDCEVIDYGRIENYKNFMRVSLKASLKGKLYNLLHFHYTERHALYRKFKKFTTKNMSLTPKNYNGANALHNAGFPNDAVYIVGSDQVWNCEMIGNNMHYFLDFTDSKRKYSYAASFGASNIDAWKNKEELGKCLRKFDRISVREETGKKIMEDVFQIEPQVVCDPIFLRTPQDWDELACCPNEGPYILLFIFSRNEALIDAAKRVSSMCGNIPILNIAYNIRNIPDVKDVTKLGPEEWLGYIKCAKYVFTDSFHGFAMSLNLRKQFWVGLNGSTRNCRIVDTAKRYGVEDRIFGGGAACY